MARHLPPRPPVPQADRPPEPRRTCPAYVPAALRAAPRIEAQPDRPVSVLGWGDHVVHRIVWRATAATAIASGRAFRAGGHRGRRHGVDAPGHPAHARRLRGSRGLQRGAQRDPARRGDRHSRCLPGRRRRLRDDQHLRRQPREPRRVWHLRPDRRAGPQRRPAGPPGRRRLVGAGPATLGARLHGSRHQAAHPGPHLVRRPARHLRRRGRGPAARRGRRADHRDLPGPAPGQGRDHRRPPGDRRPGRREPCRRDIRRPEARCPAHRPGDHRDHRVHAAGQRDRRGADRPRAARHRHDRPQLRHRARRDERAPALPGRALPAAAVVHAQRRAAPAHRRRGLLPGAAR